MDSYLRHQKGLETRRLSKSRTKARKQSSSLGQVEGSPSPSVEDPSGEVGLDDSVSSVSSQTENLFLKSLKRNLKRRMLVLANNFPPSLLISSKRW